MPDDPNPPSPNVRVVPSRHEQCPDVLGCSGTGLCWGAVGGPVRHTYCICPAGQAVREADGQVPCAFTVEGYSYAIGQEHGGFIDSMVRLRKATRLSIVEMQRIMQGEGPNPTVWVTARRERDLLEKVGFKIKDVPLPDDW